MNSVEIRQLTKALERLSERDTKKKPSRLWVILNSAFGLWLLTTVIVGGATTIWTQRNECLAGYATSETRFRKSLLEYRFRTSGYSEALSNAKNDAGYAAAERWRGADSEYIYAEYKGRTLADVTVELLTSFGALATYSDVASFDIDPNELVFTRKNGRSIVFPEAPSALELNKRIDALTPLPTDSPIAKEAKEYFAAPVPEDLQKRFQFLRNDLRSERSVFGQVRAAATLRPSPMCSPKNLLARMFADSNATYEQQVNRFFEKVFSQRMVEILNITTAEAIIRGPLLQKLQESHQATKESGSKESSPHP